MKIIQFLLAELNKKTGSLFFLHLSSLLLIFGCSNGGQIGGLEYQEMSLNEAQELLLFDVCLPDYVPDGLHQETTVIYQADFEDPNEGNVTINYLNNEDNSISLSIAEYYAPVGTQRSPDYQEFDSDILTRDLLAWMIGWDYSMIYRDQVSVSYQIITNTIGTDYRILAITDPETLRGTIIRWSLGPVSYDVYSYLPYDLTLSFSQSIGDCNY